MFSFSEAPFILSKGLFVKPKFRGTRLTYEDWSVYQQQEIRIHNARLAKPPTNLEREGFQLADSSIRLDFQDPQFITTELYRHCGELVKAATGCSHTKVVQHEFRDGIGDGPKGRGAYARIIHSDICPYIEDTVSSKDGRHFAVYTVWRNINPDEPVNAWPLALCDAKTIADNDIVYADSLRRTEPATCLVDCRLVHNPGQLWYYFPKIASHEAIIFKQYDTRPEREALRITFHTAFEDPATPDNAPLRRSIEVRVVAFFAENDSDEFLRKSRFQANIPTKRYDGSVSTVCHERMIDWDYG